MVFAALLKKNTWWFFFILNFSVPGAIFNQAAKTKQDEAVMMVY